MSSRPLTFMLCLAFFLSCFAIGSSFALDLDDDDLDLGDDDDDLSLDDDDDISLDDDDDIGGMDTSDVPTRHNRPQTRIGRDASFADNVGPIPDLGRKKAAPTKGPQRGKNFVNGAGIFMIWCPVGRFVMGSPKNEKRRRADEGPRHWVSFERGFWMSAHEVSQKQYKLILNENPSHFKGHNRPVENVTWYEASRFCSELHNLEAAAERTPEDYSYTLPSEAQWEYACRAGTYTAFNSGPRLSHSIANFGRNRYKHAHFVGRTVRVDFAKPNEFGFFHMHGNVREWCKDRYRSNYLGAPVDGSPMTNGTTTLRVARGGSFGTIAAYCRSAHRAAVEGATRNRHHGFRIVLTPPFEDGLVRLAP